MTVLGSAMPSVSSNGSKTLLDLTYRHNALLLNEGLSMGLSSLGIKTSLSLPLPLLGFVYENPNEIGLLKYSYSEYPYLNKSLIVNSYIKENTNFSIVARKVITAQNGVVVNIAANELMFKTLEDYCDKGGTFTLLTMWGAFSNLVLEELKGIPPEGNEVAGCGFLFTFKRLNFSKNLSDKVIDGTLSNLSKGLL
ncbi:TPA: hypothetical protein RTG63_001674 [Campylobacter jejuni]|nr:hypothetical protein [Campylobacter jejuni]